MSVSGNEKAILSIMGKEIEYEYCLIDTNQIRFYRGNPRIASILGGYGGEVTDATIDAVLWDRNETHKLKRTIEKDGGLIHPIIVYRDYVIEGNTRLCCYRHLYSETKDEKWRRIKCHVILDELLQQDIYRLLCSEHIEGKIDWEPYEKANFYCKMKREENLTLQQISGLVGESTSTVAKRMKVYELMLQNGVTDRSKYSHFEQLVGNAGIRKIAEQDPDIEQKVVDLIKSGRVRIAQDVRSIVPIYKHKTARKRLFQGDENVVQIFHDLKARAPMTDSSFMKDIEKMIGQINKLSRNERDDLIQSKRDCKKIEQLTKEMLKLCRELNVTIHLPKRMRRA